MQHEPSPRSSSLARLRLGFAVLALWTSACAVVAPYERETLARRDMAARADADLVAGKEHAQSYREGSSGGGSVKGGGCGCN